MLSSGEGTFWLYFTLLTLLYRPANEKIKSLIRNEELGYLYFTMQGLKTEGRMAEGWRLIVDDG